MNKKWQQENREAYREYLKNYKAQAKANKQA